MMQSSKIIKNSDLDHKSLGLPIFIDRLLLKLTKITSNLPEQKQFITLNQPIYQKLELYKKLKLSMSDLLDTLKKTINTTSNSSVNKELLTLAARVNVLKTELQGHAITVFRQGAPFIYAEKYANALICYEFVLQITHMISGNAPEKYWNLTLSILMNIGKIFYETAQYEDALSCFAKVLAEEINLYGDKHFKLVQSYMNMGGVKLQIQQYQDSYYYFQAAWACLQQQPPAYPDSTKKIGRLLTQKSSLESDENVKPNILNSIGVALRGLGKNNEALPYFKQALTALHDKKGELAATILNNMGLALSTQGKHQEAFRHFEMALTLYQSQGKSAHSATAQVYMNQGNLLSSQSRYDEAINHFQKSLSIRKEIFGDNSNHVAEIFVFMATAYLDKRDYTSALAYLQKAEKIYIQNIGEKNNLIANVWNNQGNVYFHQDNYTQALFYYEKAQAIYPPEIAANNLQYAQSLQNIANIRAKSGNFKLAAELFTRSEKITKALRGEESAEIADLYLNIASLKVNSNQDHAFEYFYKSLAIKKRIFGEKSRQVAALTMNMGAAYYNQGNLALAMHQLDLAYDLLLEVEGQENHLIADVLNNLAVLYRDQGKYEQAHQCLDQSYAIQKKLYGETHYHLHRIYLNKGDVYLEQEKLAEAFNCFQHALEMVKKHNEPHIRKIAIIQKNIGNVFARLNQYELAEKHYQQALTGFSDNNSKAVVLGSMSLLKVRKKDFAGALNLTFQVLQMHKDSPHQIAVSLNNIASLYVEEKNYTEAINYYKKALKSYLELYTPEHHTICDVYKRIAQTQAAYAHKLEEKVANKMREHAISQYIEILNVNDALLKKRIEELNGYDWSGHLAILSELAVTYIHADKLEKAGELYYEQLKRYPKAPAIILDYCSSKAIDYLQHFVHRQQTLAKLFNQRAELAHQRQCYSVAIWNLEKSLSFQNNSLLIKKLSAWKNLIAGKNISLDADLASMLEHCHQGYHDMQILMLEQFTQGRSLSDQIKNTLLELMALINNLLDMAFGRFVRENIYKPNKVSKRMDVYYPLSASHAGLIKELEDKQIITEQKEEQSSNTISLDQDYPKVFAILAKEQAFSYYSPSANAQNPEKWQESWLEKLLAISNNSKHLGLMPQSVNNNLAERFGTLTIYNIRIIVHYVASTLYHWSFIAILQDILGIKGSQLTSASQEIFNLLKEKQYIKNGIVIHPLAIDFVKTKKCSNNQKMSYNLEKKFTAQLKQDLTAQFKPCAETLSGLLLRRCLQMSHSVVHADNVIDLDILFKNAMQACNAIITTLGKARLKVPQSALPVPPLEEKKALNQDVLATNDLSNYHVTLSNTVTALLKENKLVGVADAYLKAAKMAEISNPAMAIDYHQQSLSYYLKCPNQTNVIKTISLRLMAEYNKRKLGYFSKECINKSIKYLPPDHAKILQDKIQEYKNEMTKTTSFIDYDIYSQLMHVNETLLSTEQLLFKRICDPKNSYVQNLLSQKISNLIIKIRHVLDQAFTRFVHALIYLPNDKWVSIHIKTTIKFFAAENKKKLDKELYKKEILSDDLTKVSLDRNFPEIYQILLAAQPFSDKPQNQWLKEIIQLSNLAKHESLLLFENNDPKLLTQTIALGKTAFKETEKIITLMYKTLEKNHDEKQIQQKEEKKAIPKAVEKSSLKADTGIYSDGFELSASLQHLFFKEPTVTQAIVNNNEPDKTPVNQQNQLS